MVMAAVLGAGLVSAAQAGVIYTTFGAGGVFDTNDFVRVSSAGPGAYADNFTSPVTETVGSVSLALGEIAVGSSVTVAIHSNGVTGPGGVLGIFTSEGASKGPGPGIATFVSTTGITLDAGAEYWLSVSAADSTAGVDWYFDNQGIENVTASRTDGIWTVNGPDTALAFDVISVPEPSSVGLFVTAAAAVGMWRFRNKSVF